MAGRLHFRFHRPRMLAAVVTAVLGAATLLPDSAAQAEPIRGAGSTFAEPIIGQWSRSYTTLRADGGDYISPDWHVDYEPVGSLAGVMRLGQPDMDFAATDAPLPPADLIRRGWSQFPVVMGGIVVVANIDAARKGVLRLSAPVLADIYLGKVRSWSDAAIATLNPGMDLPDAAIEVLHRKDGSGSTLTFTSFLARASGDWRAAHGADALITWPVGRSESGTGRLTALAAATRNSIAYLEYGQATRAGLPIVAVQNRAGAFVRPEPAAFQAGLAGIGWDAAGHFYTDAIDPVGAGAYPMVTVTYAIVPRDRGATRVNRVLDLFRLAFSRSGGMDATARGYIPVPPELAGRIEAHWANTLRPATH